MNRHRSNTTVSAGDIHEVNTPKTIGPGSPKPRWIAGRVLLAAGLATAAALGFGACARSSAEAAPDVEPPAAAIYRAGHGLKLSEAGARFLGLQTEEVRGGGRADGQIATFVPGSAVLRTIRGDWVFVANGEWLLRTAVVVGADAGERVEILDGLYEGDEVVVSGAPELWLAEIAAVNGGVGCADGH